jgi:hypothetical protein
MLTKAIVKKSFAHIVAALPDNYIQVSIDGRTYQALRTTLESERLVELYGYAHAITFSLVFDYDSVLFDPDQVDVARTPEGDYAVVGWQPDETRATMRLDLGAKRRT